MIDKLNDLGKQLGVGSGNSHARKSESWSRLCHTLALFCDDRDGPEVCLGFSIFGRWT